MAIDSATDVTAWIEVSTAELLAAQNNDGGWPYYRHQASATEPTALAILALSGSSEAGDALEAGADWLGARQRSDGAFAASASHAEGSWVTPLAGIAMAQQGREASASAAVTWLLTLEVLTFHPLVPGIYGYDTSIPGWPWTPGDFSWAEPTALAMMFLKQQKQSASDRVCRAADMLRNRFISRSGWNYGEPEVLGGALFPAVTPTALVLLALADEPNEQTNAGLTWLLTQRDQLSSLLSLGWATIALNVLGVLDDSWRTHVVSRWSDLPADRRGPMGTSLCLLGLVGRPDHPMAVL